jgi:hypothetical protein
VVHGENEKSKKDAFHVNFNKKKEETFLNKEKRDQSSLYTF